MAEVITIVGLAASIVQLADTVTRLKKIYGVVKDASTDLSDLVTEIHISVKQLERSKRYFDKAPLLDVDLVSRCVQHLEQTVDTINVVVDELQTALRHNKSIGSIKFVLKSRRIQELKQKLKDAQGLMDRTERFIDQIERERASTIQLLLQEKLQQNNDVLVQMYEQFKYITQSNSVLQPPLPPITPQVTLESPKRKLLTNPERILKNREYKMALPRWLWSKAFKLGFEQRQSSIQFGLRCYNIVTQKSDIFIAIHNGDINSVKHLFANRQATPYDVLPNGDSMLGLATFYYRPHICQFLIDQGAEIGHVDHAGKSALHQLTGAFVSDIDLGRAKDYRKFKQTIIKLIEVLAELIPHDDQEVKELEAGYAGSSLYLSSMRFLLNRGFSNVQLLSHEDRAEMIMETDSLDMVKDLLGPDLSAREVFIYAKSHGLSHRKFLEDFLRNPDEERGQWSWFIQELIAADQIMTVEDFQHPIDAMRSIVGISLYHTAWLDKSNDLSTELPTESTRRLQEYLVTLQDLGADLEILGLKEQHMFLQYGWSELHYSNSDRSFSYRWRMTGLITGPCATDWKIWLAPEDREYEWAGQFWHWIENPELYIPGAFLEEGLW